MDDDELDGGSVLTAGSPRAGERGEEEGVAAVAGRPSRPGSQEELAEQIGNRERALAAFVTRVAATGYRHTHVEDVCRDVGASTRDFYTWFGKKDRCYLTVFAAFGNHVITVAERAQREVSGPWEARIRAGLEAAAEELMGRPKMVRFLNQSHHVAGCREVFLSLVARSQHVYLTDEVRQHIGDIPQEPLEAVVSGTVVYPIITCIREGKVQDIPELIPSMVYYLTLVFFGPERAARQLPSGCVETGADEPVGAGHLVSEH
jgi:AcrR family transcriptional regulator